MVRLPSGGISRDDRDRISHVNCVSAHDEYQESGGVDGAAAHAYVHGREALRRSNPHRVGVDDGHRGRVNGCGPTARGCARAHDAR